MHQKKLLSGRLIRKKSLFGKVTASNVDELLDKIESSPEEFGLGVFGNYRLVLSKYSSQNRDVEGFWTFFYPEKEKDVSEYLSQIQSRLHGPLDFVDGRCFVPEDQEPEQKKAEKTRPTNSSVIFVDIPYGDIQKTRDMFIGVTSPEDFLKGISKDLTKEYAGRSRLFSIPPLSGSFPEAKIKYGKIPIIGRLTPEAALEMRDKTQYADGYFIPGPDSQPYAGEHGKRSKVSYRKFILLMKHELKGKKSDQRLAIENEVENHIITQIRESTNYETPVVGIIDDSESFFRAMFDIPKKIMYDSDTKSGIHYLL